LKDRKKSETGKERALNTCCVADDNDCINNFVTILNQDFSISAVCLLQQQFGNFLVHIRWPSVCDWTAPVMLKCLFRDLVLSVCI